MKVACIPAYNEERTIGRVVLLARKHVDKVLVCDDGSSDLTADIAEGLGAMIIRHSSNLGKGAALRTLFSACRDLGVDMMVTIDGDGQHDPDEIPMLFEALEKSNADIVVGNRFMAGGPPVPSYRKVGNLILNYVTARNVGDTQSGFRAYDKYAVRDLLPAEMGMGADSEILMDALSKGLVVVEVPITVKYGIGKTSTHNPAYHSLDVLFSAAKLTSIRHPLLFYGVPGLVLISLGLFYANRALSLFVTQQQITNVTMTYELIGFAFALFGLLVFFTGIILFTLVTVVRKERG